MNTVLSCLTMRHIMVSSYLNGHCFVSLMISVPVMENGKTRYLSVPVGYRMWTKEESKLKIASRTYQTRNESNRDRKESLCFAVTAGIQKQKSHNCLKNLKIWISSAMSEVTLSCMNCLRNAPERKADPASEEKEFL